MCGDKILKDNLTLVHQSIGDQAEIKYVLVKERIARDSIYVSTLTGIKLKIQCCM